MIDNCPHLASDILNKRSFPDKNLSFVAHAH